MNNYDINYRGELLTFHITYEANGGTGSHVGPVGPTDPTGLAALTLASDPTQTDSTYEEERTEEYWDEYSGQALSQTGDPLTVGISLFLLLVSSVVAGFLFLRARSRYESKC